MSDSTHAGTRLVERRGVEAHQHVRAVAGEVADLVELLEQAESLREMARGGEVPGVPRGHPPRSGPRGGRRSCRRSGRPRPAIFATVALWAARKPLPSSRTNDKSAAFCSSSKGRSPQLMKNTASKWSRFLPFSFSSRFVTSWTSVRMRRVPEAGFPAQRVKRHERVGYRLVLPASGGADRQQAARAPDPGSRGCWRCRRRRSRRCADGPVPRAGGSSSAVAAGPGIHAPGARLAGPGHVADRAVDRRVAPDRVVLGVGDQHLAARLHEEMLRSVEPGLARGSVVARVAALAGTGHRADPCRRRPPRAARARCARQM